jgi:DNA-binding NtrC family response regulator
VKVLIVDDQRSARKVLKDILDPLQGIELSEAASLREAQLAIEQNQPDLALVDIRLSERPTDRGGLELLGWLAAKQLDVPAVMVTVSSELSEIREAMRLGAKDYVLKDELCPEMLLPIVEGLREKMQLSTQVRRLRQQVDRSSGPGALVGSSLHMQRVRELIARVADSDAPVLIRGETGTGKELVARAIHGLSARKDRALVKMNCAALPSNLIESELFGHEKGAFTDAHSRRLGRFELANGTTLFLDEIGELPLDLQPKLLQVIETGEFERLGSSDTIKVDVRIIAATNRNLEDEVRKGTFREDLWYRLNIFPITMPPLRERREDIPLLVNYFIDKISKRLGKTIGMVPVKVMDALRNYHWSGNIRELENVLERAVINSSGPKLHLVDELKKPNKELTTANRTLADVEREYMLRVLEQTHWKVSGNNSAAEVLGLDRSTLRARMRKLDIHKP